MHRSAALFCMLCLGLLAGCSSSGHLTEFYEGDDLVMVRHNEFNDYMLLVYQDVLGQTRHVIRRGGVCEMVITYLLDGVVELKTRGRRIRKLDPHEVSRLTQQVNSLLKAGKEASPRISSTE